MTDRVLHLHSVHFERGPEVWGTDASDYSELEKGFKPLSRRALIMAGPDDVVIADRQPDAEYMARLRACGAGGARVIVPSHMDSACLADDAASSSAVVSLLKKWDGRVETYMPSAAEERLSLVVGKPVCQTSARVADILNDKMFFIRILEDIGAPMIPVFAANSDAIANRLRKWDGTPVIVRGSRSVGGSRVWVARDEREARRAVKDMDRAGRDRTFIMQPFVEHAFSPNLQFYVDSERAHLFGETAQVMTDDKEHIGNLFDSADDTATREKLIELGGALALEAAALGYRGVLGVDFIVTDEGDVYPVEINARHNTSTHALWFVNRFFNGDPYSTMEPGRAAYLRFPTKEERSAMEWIKLFGADAFDPGSGVGIMPYDTGGHELSAVIGGRDFDDRARLMEKAKSLAG